MKKQERESRENCHSDKSVDIGHTFTKESVRKLPVGEEGFLIPEEQLCFRDMLKNRGKTFAFSPKEIGCADPRIVEPMVIFTIDHVL